jgi:hypothetical protein
VIEKCKLLHNRRNTESGAFHDDILTLKRKVTDYEKYIKGMKELVD